MDESATRGLVRGMLAGIILVAGSFYVVIAATILGLHQALSASPDLMRGRVATASLLLLLITTAALGWAVLYKRSWWSPAFVVWLALLVVVELTLPSIDGAGLLSDPVLLPGTLAALIGLAALLYWTTRSRSSFDTSSTQSPPL
jgi:hypothetical protein